MRGKTEFLKNLHSLWKHRKGAEKGPFAAVSYRSRMRGLVFAFLYGLSPVILARFRFLMSYGRWLDLENPQSLDEKLLWLMLYWRHPLKTQCGDKYAVRSYVEEYGLGQLLPKILGVYESSREIDFAALPRSFVLKCSHGSSFNIICQDKSKLNFAETRRILDAWLMVDYSTVYGELHYSGMKPRIICEPFLGAPDGSLPLDYKVYCFEGRAYCTMVCAKRNINGQNAIYYFYDRDWKARLPYEELILLYDREIPKPESYDKMIDAAQMLSGPFPFVRVDFYCIQGRTVFSEMTFTPNACIDTGFTDIEQNALGNLIRLPQKHF
jgi:hypothetical protein